MDKSKFGLKLVIKNYRGKKLDPAKILNQLEFCLSIKKRLEFDYETIFKALLFKELKGLKSDRSLVWYLHGNPAEATLLGFDKDINNNVRIPSRRAIAYFKSKLLTSQDKALLETTFKLINETIEKFNIKLDRTSVASKLIEIKESNFQYQKERKLIEAVEIAKRFLSKEIKLNVKPNSKYSKAEMLNVFLHSALENQFTHGGAESFRKTKGYGPVSATLLRNIRLKDLTELKESFEKAIDKVLDKSIRQGRLQRKVVDVAIDYTLIHYYGDGACPDIVRSKDDRGTNKYFGFITLDVVDKGCRLTVKAIPIFGDLRKEPQADLVRQLVEYAKSKFKIRYILMDRGFASAETFRALKELKVNYIVPLPEDVRIKGLIATLKPPFVVKDYLRGGEVIPNVVLVNGQKGLMKLATNIKLSKDDVVLLNRLPIIYGERWGIETGYRVKKRQGMVKTTSNDYKVRFFYFMLSVLLYDAWILTGIIVAVFLGKFLAERHGTRFKSFLLALETAIT